MLTFPFITDHQTIVNFANSARSTMALSSHLGARSRLHEIHAQRIHELMGFRPHTVNTDG